MKHDFLPLFLILLSAGCQNMSFPEDKEHILYSSSDFTHVISSDTPYYEDGPQQARPQDGYFRAGTKLKLVKNMGSYSLVESAEGIRAYVAVSAVKEL